MIASLTGFSLLIVQHFSEILDAFFFSNPKRKQFKLIVLGVPLRFCLFSPYIYCIL